jgi:hypothetical protein
MTVGKGDTDMDGIGFVHHGEVPFALLVEEIV